MCAKKMAKRSLSSDATSSTAKHCKSGVDPKWETFCGLRYMKPVKEVKAYFVHGVENTAIDQKKLELGKLLG